LDEFWDFLSDLRFHPLGETDNCKAGLHVKILRKRTLP
jgi:hypothetical protein